MSAPLVIRPVPVRDAFRSVQGATAFLGSIAAILVGFGVLTAVQGSALEGLIGAVPGVVALVGDVIRSFQVSAAVEEAEAAVTPTADPVESVLVEDPSGETVEVFVPLVRDGAFDPYANV